MVNINLKQLIEQKELLIKELEQAEVELTSARVKLKMEESKLWTDTPFKELGLTNDKTRTAYVQRNLVNHKLEYEQRRNEFKSLNRNLELCNDKMKLFV